MTKQILLYGLDLDPPKTAASPIDCELLKRAAAAHADRMKDKPRCACMATDPQQCADDRYGRRYPWEREFYDEAEPCTCACHESMPGDDGEEVETFDGEDPVMCTEVRAVEYTAVRYEVVP